MREQDTYYDDQGKLHLADALVGEEKDYAIDWANRMVLEGDEIQAVVWDIPTGLTEVATNVIDSKATIWLRADTVGTYAISCAVTTNDNGSVQKYIREVYITVL